MQLRVRFTLLVKDADTKHNMENELEILLGHHMETVLQLLCWELVFRACQTIIQCLYPAAVMACFHWP